MPRRRRNQCEILAIRGPKPAEAPTPIRPAWTSGELPDRARHRPQPEAGAEHQPGRDHRPHDAEAVDQAADDHVAGAEADHRRGVGQRRARPVDAELRLHIGQHDDHRPHANAGNGAEQHRNAEAEPRVGTVDEAATPVRAQALRSHGFFSRIYRPRRVVQVQPQVKGNRRDLVAPHRKCSPLAARVSPRAAWGREKWGVAPYSSSGCSRAPPPPIKASISAAS